MVDSVRFALRQMRKNPGFVTLAIVTLALGIGANTAMFTVIDSVMLRPLPYPDGDRIVAITTGDAAQGNAVNTTSWPNYKDIREQARQLRAVGAYAEDFAVVRTADMSEATTAIRATSGLFDVLNVRPAMGRSFVDSDNQPGASAVVILTWPFWKEHFGSDPNVVGKQVRVGDDPFTIVGVLPAGFRFNDSDASQGILIPFQLTSDALTERDSNFLYLLGSLRPGVSTQAAQAEMSSIARGITQKDPKDAKNLAFRVLPFRDVVSGRVRPVFLALIGALILVLLIACANVANLQLARCLARSQELAVRTALGATRRALLVQMLIEGGVLCLFGAVAGVGLAQLMLGGIHRLPPDLIPRAEEIHLRLSIFLVLLIATVIVTLLSSIVPAVVATLSDPQTVLQEGTRGASSSRGRSRLSGIMVTGEVAISVILLVSGGLMFRTLYNLEHIRLGFEEENITIFNAFPGSAAGFFSMKQSPSASQQDSIALRRYGPMAEKLRHLPGVVDAAFASVLPFEGVEMRTTFHIVGHDWSAEEANHQGALFRGVSGNYARVLGTPAVRGRAINEDDTTGSPYVVTINEACARRYFAGQNPIGQQLDFAGKEPKDRAESGMLQPYTIVGVMADSIQSGITREVEPQIDLPYTQIPVKSFYYQIVISSMTNYVVKTHGPVEITSAIRNAFHESASDFALDNFQTMQEAHDQADFNQRLGLDLVASFAAIALVMVLAGLYGVLSQLVGQRRREIAIRMALGADRASVLALIVRRGFLLIGIGVAVGLAASAGVQQAVKSFFYGVSPVDWITYLGVLVVLALVGTLAALIPARRAASIEPTLALRGE